MKVERLYQELQKAIEDSPIIPPCQISDPEMWFNPSDEERRAVYKQAKELCGFCPAIQACATYALAANEQFGVWGGLTPEERDKLRRKHRTGNVKVRVIPYLPS